MTTEPTGTTERRQQAAQIARAYLTTSEGWQEQDYHLELLRETGSPDAPIMVVAAVHHDDLRAEGADPPKSLHLHIDLKGQKVLEALLCQ